VFPEILAGSMGWHGVGGFPGRRRKKSCHL